MEFLDQSYFTEDQKWIIHLRVTEKMNYRQIQSSWKAAYLNENDEFLSSGALKACLRRSSLALKWRKGKIYGNDYYLSKPDIELLKQYIEDKCQNDDPSDVKWNLVVSKQQYMNLYMNVRYQYFALSSVKTDSCIGVLQLKYLDCFSINHVESFNL